MTDHGHPAGEYFARDGKHYVTDGGGSEEPGPNGIAQIQHQGERSSPSGHIRFPYHQLSKGELDHACRASLERGLQIERADWGLDR